jgi:nucleoside-diphosphate-sugar epimerase
LRPATVCGYSRRQRLDLVVNILTNFAYHNKLIKVLGGEQLRPNININDMIRAYELIINSPNDKINGEIFNVGFENHSVNDLSIIVKQSVENILNYGIKIEKFHSEDNRSYHISSNKITNKLGFQPKFNIQDGVNDLLNCFKKNILVDPLNNENYYNIKKMKLIKLK